jgi:hypothetical protein
MMMMIIIMMMTGNVMINITDAANVIRVINDAVPVTYVI